MAQARTELKTALVAAAVPIGRVPGAANPPYGVIFGDGMDLEHIGRGQVQATFRVVLIAGKFDLAAATTALDALKLKALTAIRGLAGWRLGEVRRDTVVRIAGGDYLAADVTASRFVDIT